MKVKMNKILGLHIPSDGLTNDEKEIAHLLSINTINNLYGKLPTSRMKAIVAMYFELGYSQEAVAEVFKVNRSRIAQEIDLIKKIFLDKPTAPYNPYRKKKKRVVTLPEVLDLLMMIQAD